jgi:hypothetical protein
MTAGQYSDLHVAVLPDDALALAAAEEFRLRGIDDEGGHDELRRQRLPPLIHEEMARRGMNALCASGELAEVDGSLGQLLEYYHGWPAVFVQSLNLQSQAPQIPEDLSRPRQLKLDLWPTSYLFRHPSFFVNHNEADQVLADQALERHRSQHLDLLGDLLINPRTQPRPVVMRSQRSHSRLPTGEILFQDVNNQRHLVR